jgi:glycosyltransferase involved in cell wall biosynthesis
MHIALVTTYPPSKGTLNEYAYHLVQQLSPKEEVTRITIIGDLVPETEEQSSPLPEKVEILRVWQHGSKRNLLHILRTIRSVKPDIVWYNLQFTLFGGDPLSAGLSLMAPMLTRLMGYKSVVLLHNLMETTDLREAVGVTNPLSEAIQRAGGTVITRMLLTANLVTTTLPRYVEILRNKYGVRDVILTPHGAFTESTPPDFNSPPSRILMTFGKFGTYKKVEVLLDAYRKLIEQGVDCTVLIAGSDNPNTPGYLDGIREAYADLPGVTFTGYVAEEDIPRIFSSAQMMILPYTSTTGSSGVLHQAGMFGLPAVMPNIGDLAELIETEGFGAELFEPDNAQSLADAIRRLLDDPQYTRELGMRNYVATRGLTVSEVIDWYLLHFERLIEAHAARRPNWQKEA